MAIHEFFYISQLFFHFMLLPYSHGHLPPIIRPAHLMVWAFTVLQKGVPLLLQSATGASHCHPSHSVGWVQGTRPATKPPKGTTHPLSHQQLPEGERVTGLCKSTLFPDLAGGLPPPTPANKVNRSTGGPAATNRYSMETYLHASGSSSNYCHRFLRSETRHC